MEDVRIILAGLWIALMLTYLLGDVLRIFAGHFKPGEINGVPMTQAMMMLIAVIMLIPILMIVLSLTVPFPLIRWINLGAAVGLFIFNLVGIGGYEGKFDTFLIIVGLVFNVVTVIYAWNWAG